MNCFRLRGSLVAAAMMAAPVVMAAYLILVSPTAVLAGGTPVGDEFEVSTTGSANQISPGRSVARAGDGSFVVVWAKNFGGNSGYDIVARRYAANGTALGAEFVVNSYGTGIQRSPAVEIADSGSFIVVWADNSFRDGTFLSVFGRVVDAAGVPQGVDFVVPTYTDAAQDDPDIDLAADGSFVVVWQSSAQGQAPYSGIAARRFTANATPIGDEFMVENFTTEDQRTPVVALDGDSNFVVVWASGDYTAGLDGSRGGISARLFSSTGAPLGTEFVVNQTTADYQISPAVDRNDAGTFAIAWQDQVSESAEQSRIFARSFTATGTPITNEIQVHEGFTARQMEPGIAIDNAGRFVVAWSTYDYYGTYMEGVSAACFEANGTDDGPVFTPQNDLSEGAFRTDVAADPQGNFVLVWSRRSPVEPAAVARMYSRGAAATTSTTTSTTTTTTMSTTTTSTTSTTMPSGGGQTCGDPVVDAGAGSPLRAEIITASDALLILNAAVGLQVCAPCICDVTGEGSVTASDALLVLSAAVGLDVTLNCPPCDA